MADPGGGGCDKDDPPLELVPILKTYTGTVQGGGGVLVNVQEWGCFSIFLMFLFKLLTKLY